MINQLLNRGSTIRRFTGTRPDPQSENGGRPYRRDIARQPDAGVERGGELAQGWQEVSEPESASASQSLGEMLTMGFRSLLNLFTESVLAAGTPVTIDYQYMEQFHEYFHVSPLRELFSRRWSVAWKAPKVDLGC
jgi:hypothetical protein